MRRPREPTPHRLPGFSIKRAEELDEADASWAKTSVRLCGEVRVVIQRLTDLLEEARQAGQP